MRPTPLAYETVLNQIRDLVLRTTPPLGRTTPPLGYRLICRATADSHVNGNGKDQHIPYIYSVAPLSMCVPRCPLCRGIAANISITELLLPARRKAFVAVLVGQWLSLLIGHRLLLLLLCGRFSF